VARRDLEHPDNDSPILWHLFAPGGALKPNMSLPVLLFMVFTTHMAEVVSFTKFVE
jgi:fumarate reductase subunit D